MFGFTLNIKDGATPEIQSIVDRLRSSPDLAVAAAESLADLLRRHLLNLQNTRPNKMGWPRQNFWAAAYKGVQNPSRTAGGASVTINSPGPAQRYFGGDIVPDGHPFLAIPARAEAYGKNPRDFDNLVPVVHGDRGMLVERLSTDVRSRQEGGGGVMFWLVKRVHQDPDPSVLPTQDEMEAAVVQGAQTRINRLLSGGKQP